VEINGKAGIYFADTRQTIRVYDVLAGENGGHDRSDASQSELFAGIGATWNAGQNFALRVEYQRFFDVGDDEKNYEQDIDVISRGGLLKSRCPGSSSTPDPGPALSLVAQAFGPMRRPASIVTASTGTSWWPPRLPVFTATMASTTSMPESTRPNTA